MSQPDFDAIDRLRRHDPLSGRAETPEMSNEALASRVYGRIDFNDELTVARWPLRRSLRSRRAWILVPVFILGSLLLTAAVISRTRHADDPTQVACYSAVDLSSNTVVLPMESSPIATCNEAWEDPANSALFGGVLTPRLAACVLESGVAAVFPADGVDPCQTLGLASWERADSNADLGQRFQANLIERTKNKCIEPQLFAEIAQEELDRAKMDDWSVAVAPAFEPSRICGSLHIEWPEKTVVVVPFEKPDDWIDWP